MPAVNKVAVDTSVAIPLLVASHVAHRAVISWAQQHTLVLSGHALAETYSVLTRLPGAARLSPQDAVRLIEANFAETAVVDEVTSRNLHQAFANAAIAGGAVYDALVATAAAVNDLPLATRDARAQGTYQAIGVRVITLAQT